MCGTCLAALRLVKSCTSVGPDLLQEIVLACEAYNQSNCPRLKVYYISRVYQPWLHVTYIGITTASCFDPDMGDGIPDSCGDVVVLDLEGEEVEWQERDRLGVFMNQVWEDDWMEYL